MRIGIDAHAIGSNLGGNETYAEGLLEGLGKIGSAHHYIAYFTSQPHADRWRDRYPNIAVRVLETVSSPSRLVWGLSRAAMRDRLDLLHVQYVGPLAGRVPIVTTVHDLSYRRYPEYFPGFQARRLDAGIGWTLRRARRVITVSRFSADEIARAYPRTSGRIDVVHNGIDHTRFFPMPAGDARRAVAHKFGVNSHFVLAVGNLQPRKNLVRLAQAYRRVEAEAALPGLRLVLVGRRARGWEQATEAAGPNTLVTGYVEPDDLRALYRAAAVFAYPSIYEGFGLPVLESMACGTPVVTSDRTSLPEVAQDAAVLVDPTSVDAICEGIALVLRDSALAAALSRKGLQRAADFSWENAAAGCEKSYRAAQ